MTGYVRTFESNITIVKKVESDTEKRLKSYRK